MNKQLQNYGKKKLIKNNYFLSGFVFLCRASFTLALGIKSYTLPLNTIQIGKYIFLSFLFPQDFSLNIIKEETFKWSVTYLNV